MMVSTETAAEFFGPEDLTGRVSPEFRPRHRTHQISSEQRHRTLRRTVRFEENVSGRSFFFFSRH